MRENLKNVAFLRFRVMFYSARMVIGQILRIALREVEARGGAIPARRVVPSSDDARKFEKCISGGLSRNFDIKKVRNMNPEIDSK